MIGALIVLAGVVVIQQLILIKRSYSMSAATDALDASITKLSTDVAALITAAQAGPQAAVDAFATTEKAKVDAIDVTVVAATPTA